MWSVYHLGDRVVPAEHAVKITEEDHVPKGIPGEKRRNDPSPTDQPRKQY